MALTEKQDIPIKPIVKEPWTFRRLFPFAGSTTALAKTFVNPLEILLGYLVFILGVTELFGRSVSWMFWIFTTLILLTTLYERYEKRKSSEAKVEPEVKKEEEK